MSISHMTASQSEAIAPINDLIIPGIFIIHLIKSAAACLNNRRL
ncbi:Uncharacterized protein {ECO:0000313/EMBL:CCF11774.1} [Pantoea ananatis]|nr:Uncharacterized protein {ECO:0000313/EMBL:CCF11774.1} [Pantoea ananatis]